MPRRKGQGISPTKRVASKDGGPQARKKPTQSPDRLGEMPPVPTVAPKAKSDDHNSKYLHKKFKKMATAFSQQAPEPRAGLSPTQPDEVLVNGIGDTRSLIPGHETVAHMDDFNATCNTQTEDEPLELVMQGVTITPLPGKYVCSYCKLVCAKPSVLQKHIRAHTNERPYPCIPCGFAFKTKSNLYKHCRSRAHALKTDEHGTKLTFPLEESSDMEDEDDENNSNNALLTNSVHSNNNSPPPTDGSPPHEPGTPQQIPSDSTEKRPIYKPKFHKAAMYHEEENVLSQSPKKSPNLSLKIPVPNLTSFSGMGGLSKTPTSLSPEFLQRHISKIISENQAIVETMDLWPKKRLRDRDGSPASPLSASSSPGGDPLNWPKKLLQRQMSTNESGPEDRIKVHQSTQSKLATALLKPPPTPEPSTYIQQPLNLTTNNSKDTGGSSSRKRCFSEGFGGVQPKQGAILKDHTVENVINNRTQHSKGRIDHVVSEGLAKNVDKLFHPQNPEGSIIKDLLLKARAASAAGLSLQGIQDIVDCNLVSTSLRTLSVDDSGGSPPNAQHVCQLCKIPYRNAENLEIHQLYYCKGDDGIDMPHMPHTPQATKGKPKLDLKISPVKDGSQISQPFPSPGPLLGNTPLVESYCFGQPQKKQRLDCEATTLRSLEELSKSPMRSNSLQMFGGEVSILDGAGETKTMRIEPRGKSPSASEYMNMPNVHQPGTVAKSECTDNSGSNSPHMVVTIARSGLNSGGTIVQVPIKTPTSSAVVKPPRSSGGSVRSSPSPITLSPLHTPPKHSLSLSSSPSVSSSSMLGTPFSSTPKLLAPLVPNITTPNLAVPGIPAPSLDHHLPFVPFASILPDGTLLNPLTNITAFNPLTLPAIRSKECGNGVVAILHGGKVIPYVQGMPGPQSLSTSLPMTVSRSDGSPKPLNLASPCKEQLPTLKIDPPQNKDLQQTHVTKNKLFKSSNSTNSPCTVIASSHRNMQPRETSGWTGPTRSVTPKTRPPRSITPKTRPLEPSPPVDGQDLKRTTQASRKSIPGTNASSRKEVNEVGENEKPNLETEVDVAKNDPSRPKFLRPTSLPLKPGTFVPKQHPSPGYGNVLSLVSPETPRPKKSYGQLYLNGHAYTYLGLKCSTRPFYCTLNRTQPMYVPQSPDHAKISMYSNWKICPEADPNLLGLDAGKALALYDCRHRSSMYTVAVTSNKPTTVVTHSSYWSSRRQGGVATSEKSQGLTPGEPSTKRVKIFDGGFESNEDYIYVRGRGRGRYVCEECGIRCKKPSMLKKHIRTHTDVRPFTCRHCTFSFKTKGNLTKHMKSKAHYKKCVELGILPVPTAVDDSCVDEDCLARQQALRASRRRAASDGDETDSEEDDDEDEEEEDEEDDEDMAEDDTLKGRLEREAARSLLSLSVVPLVAPDPQYLALGLLPRAAQSRPATYPYQQLSAELGSLGQEQTSKTSSGVPCWLGPTGEKNRCYFPSVRRPPSTSLTGSPPTSLSGRENTLSPNSSNSPNSPCSTTSKPSPRPLDSTDSSDKIDRRLSKEFVEDNLKFGQSRESDQAKNGSRNCLEIKPEICVRNVKDNYDTYNWVSKVVAKARGGMDTETSEDDSLGPMDLSNKRVNSIQKLSSRPTPLSILLPPVLLASSTESPNPMLFPGDGAETTMLHAYLTEKALQHARIKQHQKRQNQHTQHGHSTDNLPTVPIPQISREATKEATSSSLKFVDILAANECKNKEKEVAVRMSEKTEKDLVYDAPNSVSSSSEREEETSGVESGVEASKPEPPPTELGGGVGSKLKDKSTDNASDNVCCMLRDDDVVRNVVLGGFAFGGSDLSIGRKTPPGSVKAEFMPPASGPSPSYVSVLEDGRSICVICNKIFSKPSQLRLHVNIHYFERPFRCEACAVSFRTRGHLQKHERSSSHQNKVSMNSTFGTATMTNPRPFKCDDCKIAFRIHGHLAKHLRSKMHIMKLECVGKLPFGTYAEMEREGVSLNEIDTSDCDNSLESLQVLAQKLYEKDPSKLGQWEGGLESLRDPVEDLNGDLSPQRDLSRDLDGDQVRDRSRHRRRRQSGDRTRDWSGGDTSSDDGEPWLGPSPLQTTASRLEMGDNIHDDLEDTDTSDGDIETIPNQRSSRLPEQATETNNGQGWEQLTSERVRVRRPITFKQGTRDGTRDKEKGTRELKR